MVNDGYVVFGQEREKKKKYLWGGTIFALIAVSILLLIVFLPKSPKHPLTIESLSALSPLGFPSPAASFQSPLDPACVPDAAVWSNNRRWALVPCAVKRRFRHSSYATYTLVSKTGAVHPWPWAHKKLMLVQWGETETFAFVMDSDVYTFAIGSGKTVRVTHDGDGNVILNGIQNWLYEEELFATDSALAFGPGDKELSFLRSNQSMVPLRTLPFYQFSKNNTNLPDHWSERYSRVGDPIPRVSLRTFEFETNATSIVHTTDNTYIASFSYHGDALFYELFDRFQTTLTAWLSNVVLYKKTDGWLTPVLYAQGKRVQLERQAIEPRGRIITLRDGKGEPQVLVASDMQPMSVIGVTTTDAGLGVWFRCALPTPASSRVCFQVGQDVKWFDFDVSADAKSMSMTLVPSTQDPEPLWSSATCVDPTACPETGPERVSYLGPEPPVHFEKGVVVQANQALRDELAKWDIPVKVFDEDVAISDGLTTGGYMLSIEGTRPVAIVSNNYGGPDSQSATHAWSVGINDVIVSQSAARDRPIAVVAVDVGGATMRGYARLRRAYGALGNAAAADTAVSLGWYRDKYGKRSTKLGAWGWSFGGHVSSKVLATNASIDFAVAVAPVTLWELYDAAYTERYQHANFAVSDVIPHCATMPSNAFLLMHGTNDDNVHYLNSALLAECLAEHGVDFEFFSFVNKDHGISGQGARPLLYKRLMSFLFDQTAI